MNMQQLGESVLAQDEQKIRTYFHPKAYVNWHCTNEHFSVEEFIQANCEYPGEWGGTGRGDRRADHYRDTCLYHRLYPVVPCYIFYQAAGG